MTRKTNSSEIKKILELVQKQAPDHDVVSITHIGSLHSIFMVHSVDVAALTESEDKIWFIQLDCESGKQMTPIIKLLHTFVEISENKF